MDRPRDLGAILVCLFAHPNVHGWHRGRAVLILTAYCVLTGVLAWMWTVTPAMALVSSTGYVRVVPNTAQLAYLGANRTALISTVAQAAASASPVSVAIRMVAGPIGWAALGVTVGLALMQTYYSQTELEAVKTATPIPSTLQKADGTISSPRRRWILAPVPIPVRWGKRS